MEGFTIGDRIIFHHAEDGRKVRGRITQLPGRDQRYAVVTDSNRRVKVHVDHIHGKSPDRVLILEGRLDKNLRSNRSYGPTFQSLLSAYSVEALYEKIHTRHDLQAFLKREGRKPEFRVIHLMCHGIDQAKAGSVLLQLTHEKFDLVEHKDLFHGLKGKVLIFSSCEIGKDAVAMQLIKEESQAAAVIAYTRMVDDYYTNIAEQLLYHQLFENQASPAKAVEAVREMLRIGKVRISEHITRAPVIACF